MREGWTETTLGDIAEVVGGGTPSTAKEEFWDGDVIWLTPTEVTALDGKVISDSKRKITKAGLQSSGARVLPKGTVILTSRASVGFVALAGTELTTNQGFQSLIPSERVEGVFLMFWIQINRAEFESRSAGSTFKEISKSNVKSIAINLPPLVEQKRIVDVVSSVDVYIDALQQQADTARTARNAVLHELLSAVGDDWTETTLGDLCEIYQPETISKAKMDDSAPYVVYGANGPVGRYSRFNHEEPEVVVTCRGATCGVVNMTPSNCWITGNAMVVKPRDNRSTKGFLFWALQTTVDVQATISGSAQPQITRTGLAPSKIQVPPIDEQKRIVGIVSSIDDVIQSTEQAISDAKNLRSGLLSDLLSGEHEIPESYDKFVGAA